MVARKLIFQSEENNQGYYVQIQEMRRKVKELQTINEEKDGEIERLKDKQE